MIGTMITNRRPTYTQHPQKKKKIPNTHKKQTTTQYGLEKALILNDIPGTGYFRGGNKFEVDEDEAGRTVAFDDDDDAAFIPAVVVGDSSLFSNKLNGTYWSRD
jgi:hypothetical protein